MKNKSTWEEFEEKFIVPSDEVGTLIINVNPEIVKDWISTHFIEKKYIGKQRREWFQRGFRDAQQVLKEKIEKMRATAKDIIRVKGLEEIEIALRPLLRKVANKVLDDLLEEL